MKSAFTRSLTAALALTLGAIPAGVLARNGDERSLDRPGFVFIPPISKSVSVGPASGPIGSLFRVRATGPLGAAPAIVVFESRSAASPVRITLFLKGGGDNYSAQVSSAVCQYGKRSWDVHVSLTNRQEIKNVGTFTPTNCVVR